MLGPGKIAVGGGDMKGIPIGLFLLGLGLLYGLGRSSVNEPLFEGLNTGVFLGEEEMPVESKQEPLEALEPWAFPILKPKAVFYDEITGRWMMVMPKVAVAANAGLCLMGIEQALYPVQFEGFSRACSGVRLFLRDVATKQSWVLQVGERVPVHGYMLVAFDEGARRMGGEVIIGEYDPSIILSDNQGGLQVLTQKTCTYVGPLRVKLRDSAGQFLHLEHEGPGIEQGPAIWRLHEASHECQVVILEKTDLLTKERTYVRIEYKEE